MARYFSKRRYDPRAEERREREAREQRRREIAKARLTRLLKQYRRVPISGDEASYAWKQREVRDFETGLNSRTILRTDGRHLYMQTPGAVGWQFYRLVPKYNVLREDGRDRARRDPPEPGEFEKNQRKGYQHVLYRVLPDGEVVALFPKMRKSKDDARVMLYRMSTGKEWHDRESILRMVRHWLKATPREERPLYLHLTNDHGYKILT